MGVGNSHPATGVGGIDGMLVANAVEAEGVIIGGGGIVIEPIVKGDGLALFRLSSASQPAACAKDSFSEKAT